MSFSLNSCEKLIIALDGMDHSEVLSLLSKLPKLRWVKVGLELFLLMGPEVLQYLQKRNLKVFLDLKFHDIPATMAGACRQAASTGAQLITVHASAGRIALEEANKAAIEGADAVGLPPPTLLGVTVLTSVNKDTFIKEMGAEFSLQKRVEFLAKIAYESGIGGCVCSPLEVRALRRLYPQPFELITPGIRNQENSFDDDQARVMTPGEAVSAGSSRLVVGRPITRAADPESAFNCFIREIEMSQRG